MHAAVDSHNVMPIDPLRTQDRLIRHRLDRTVQARVDSTGLVTPGILSGSECTGGDTVSQTPKMGSECGGGDAVAQSGLTMMPP